MEMTDAQQRRSEAVEGEHMPCTCEHQDNSDEYRRQADAVTELLCSLCQRIDKLHLGDSLVKSDRKLAAWWKHHQAIDAAREQEEQRDKDAASLRRKAKSKLTPKERVALGIK
jgi:hypothetical protein